MSYITDKKAEVRRQVEELIENDTLHQGPLEDCLDTLIDSIVSEVQEIGTREILKSRTVEEALYGLGGRETTARAQAAVDFQFAFKHLREETT